MRCPFSCPFFCVCGSERPDTEVKDSLISSRMSMCAFVLYAQVSIPALIHVRVFWLLFELRPYVRGRGWISRAPG